MKKRCFLLACFSVILTAFLLCNLCGYPKASTQCANYIDAEVTLISEFGLIKTSDYSRMSIGVVSFKIGDVLYGVGHVCNMQNMGKVYKMHPRFNKGTEDAIGNVSLETTASGDALLGEVIYNGDDGILISTKDLNTDEYQTIKVANKVISGEAELLVRDETRKLNSYDITVKVIVENGKERLDVCITDQKLLEKTGGILQGMSGSPIIQDGRLIGILSHVYEHEQAEGKAQIIWEIDCIKEYYREN